jgi:rare lipoprotein A (peptidoglycan hydrolase)
MVTVKNLDNGKTVDCYVNDYGPEEWTKREIDLSSHAFAELAPLSLGLLNVEVYAKQDTER